MTVRFYSSTDAGAPQIDNNPGFLVSILRSCLVTGYGTRTPAGWSIAFEDLPNNKIAFQQGGASGRFLKVDHSADYRYAAVNGYDTMSDIDTGTEGMYDDNPEGGMGYWPCSQDTSPRWVVIADERNLYLGIYDFSGENIDDFCWSWLGDFENAAPDNNYAFGMVASLTSSAASSHHSQGAFDDNDNSSRRRMMRSLSGLAGAGAFKRLESSLKFGARSNLAYPAPAIGGLVLRKSMLVCNTTRGYLGDYPLILEPLNYFDGSRSAYPHRINILEHGNRHLVLISSSYQNRAWAFEVDVVDG